MIFQMLESRREVALREVLKTGGTMSGLFKSFAESSRDHTKYADYRLWMAFTPRIMMNLPCAFMAPHNIGSPH